MSKAGETDDTVYLLEENDGHIDVYLCHQGIGVECARWLDRNSAQQLSRGIAAVLSGSFVRATSLTNYLTDLEVQKARTRTREAGTSIRNPKPELDML